MVDIFHHLIHEHSDKENERYRRIHEKQWIIFIDKYIYVIAAMSITMTLPQIWDIWVIRNVSGISLASWLAYTVASVAWLVYGIGHKEKILIFTNAIWVFLDLMIVLGIILFR